MPAKKYQNITVSKQVNVSSSYHYHFTVKWDGGGRDYSLRVGFLTNHQYNPYTWEAAPKYLEREVERQILAMFEDKTAVFYEYDRDGNKRYENLRYWSQEDVDHYIESLKQSLNE